MVTEDIKKCNCDEALCCCGRRVVRSARAEVGQVQSVFQLSNSLQVAAIAISTDGGTAKSSQQTCQSNTDFRGCSAIATSCTTLTCDDICEDSSEIFSASDQQNLQDLQANFNSFLVTTALAGADGTAIARDCLEQPNLFNEVRITMATSCAQVAATQPDNMNQKENSMQYRAPENLDSILKQTPLSSININGKVIQKQPQNQSQTIKQVVFNEENSDDENSIKKAVALSFDKFHVSLNLDGIVLDAEVDKAGNVLVDGKEVRK